MKRNKYSVRKYFASTAIVTAVVFSSMLASGVSAHGGPQTEANSNKAPVTVEKQVEKETVKSPSNLLRKGSRGDGVKSVQTSLGLTADGIFGSNTESAVKSLQSKNGLAADGVVGPATRSVLSTAKPAEKVTNKAPKQEAKQETKKEKTKSSTSKQTDVTSVAKDLVGKPYVPAGTTPAGFDSSGFINYAFAEVGVPLERTHASMWASNGTHVNSPSVGDVVFFEGTYKNGVSHSGIYLGDNQMIHAGTSRTGVEITSMGYDYWQDRYIGAKRF